MSLLSVGHSGKHQRTYLRRDVRNVRLDARPFCLGVAVPRNNASGLPDRRERRKSVSDHGVMIWFALLLCIYGIGSQTSVADLSPKRAQKKDVCGSESCL